MRGAKSKKYARYCKSCGIGPTGIDLYLSRIRLFADAEGRNYRLFLVHVVRVADDDSVLADRFLFERIRYELSPYFFAVNGRYSSLLDLVEPKVLVDAISALRCFLLAPKRKIWMMDIGSVLLSTALIYEIEFARRL